MPKEQPDQNMKLILQTKSSTINLTEIPKDYNQLVKELQNQYLYEITNVIFKYQDSDNDIISIENTVDLLVAYEYIQDESLKELLIFTTFEMSDKLIKLQSSQQASNSEFVEGQKLENSFVMESFSDAEIINLCQQEKEKQNSCKDFQKNTNYLSETNIQQFCEIFKSIEVNSEDIAIKCSKCQYYKEDVNCKKCSGKKEIHPTELQCDLVNAILNFKIEQTLKQLLQHNEEKKKEN